MDDNNTENTSKECKFCLEEDKVYNLISPCKCSGSLKYVHLKCLEKYHEKRYLEKCEICRDSFDYSSKIIKKKFTSLFIIYTVCVLNNFFGTLLTFDLDFKKTIFIIGYIIIYHYFFIKKRLFEVNIIKNRRIMNPEKNNSLYLELNNIYTNNLYLSFTYTFMYKFLKFVTLINTEFVEKIYKSIFFCILLCFIFKLYLYIREKSIEKNIITKN